MRQKCTIQEGPTCGQLDFKGAGNTRYQSEVTGKIISHAEKLRETHDRMHAKSVELISKSKYGSVDSGVLLLERSYYFILKFITYDQYTADGEDYPLAKAFEKIYSSTESLTLMFPRQIMLSQKRPRQEIRIDHLKEIGSQFEFPSDTYAYTTTTEQVYLFSKPVAIESFWLRIHQPPQAYKNQEYGTRFLILMNGDQIVSKTVVALWSDEWYLITPRRGEL